MQNNKKMNVNTVILGVMFAVLGFLGKESYKEVKSTHDQVLIIKAQMVSHTEFDVEIMGIKSDIMQTKSRLAEVEKDIQKMKVKQ